MAAAAERNRCHDKRHDRRSNKQLKGRRNAKNKNKTYSALLLYQVSPEHLRYLSVPCRTLSSRRWSLVPHNSTVDSTRRGYGRGRGRGRGRARVGTRVGTAARLLRLSMKT